MRIPNLASSARARPHVRSSEKRVPLVTEIRGFDGTPESREGAAPLDRVGQPVSNGTLGHALHELRHVAPPRLAVVDEKEPLLGLDVHSAVLTHVRLGGEEGRHDLARA